MSSLRERSSRHARPASPASITCTCQARCLSRCRVARGWEREMDGCAAACYLCALWHHRSPETPIACNTEPDPQDCLLKKCPPRSPQLNQFLKGRQVVGSWAPCRAAITCTHLRREAFSWRRQRPCHPCVSVPHGTLGRHAQPTSRACAKPAACLPPPQQNDSSINYLRSIPNAVA